ncbi:hypothetical protein CAPTEDRAFT_124377 [Capitella teleta]|uniref:G-protein coupled receptors family 1 profile domain-containing protein n=1 Tax=Capitella teleta TaxID=283909 RepID=R7VDA5_CAPTE|nr:hypothetical protein CAPTEDRAFT_124377 [Capitella teleta]|eukprot:ELU16813.1 hypothetical protein CAPTEDRAFT_124377 [Capitella teleta]
MTLTPAIQPNLNRESHSLIGACLIILFVLAMVGNGLIIFAFLRFQDLRIQCYILIVNLAVADFLMTTLGLPLTIYSAFSPRWPFSNSVCQLYGFSGGLFGLTSINTQAAIAIDRCLVLIRSQKAQPVRRSHRQTAFVVAIPWLYAFLWSVPPLYGWNGYRLDELQTICSFDIVAESFSSRVFVVCVGVFGFLLPLCIIIFCYSFIFVAINKYKKGFYEISESLRFSVYIGSAVVPHPKRDYKTAQIGLTCVIFFCLAWMPYAVVGWISVAGYYNKVGPHVLLMTTLFAKTSTIYNPTIYAACLPRFRRRVQYLFQSCCKPKHRHIQSRSYSLNVSKEHSIPMNNLSWEVVLSPDVSGKRSQGYHTQRSWGEIDTQQSSTRFRNMTHAVKDSGCGISRV